MDQCTLCGKLCYAMRALPVPVCCRCARRVADAVRATVDAERRIFAEKSKPGANLLRTDEEHHTGEEARRLARRVRL